MITTLAALTVLGALAVLGFRASRRRRAALDDALFEALARRFDRGLAWTERGVRLAETGGVLLRARLRRAARKTEDLERLVDVAANLLRHPLTPMSGPLSLKLHGPRIGLHLVDPVVLDLVAPEPRLAHRLEAPLGLIATYRVDGRRDRCLTEDHLREQAIDTRDVHGIALAVLRQGFDEDLARRLNEGASETLRSADGTAATHILILPDFLAPDASIEARLEGPDRLLLGPDSRRGTSDVHPTLDLAIDDRGWKVL